ncbi:hypothetical protein GCM10010170_084930 [Dactylosporangium salmoneum]|uniref:Uncharacterized protein n=1 Tax=Dactylosporangium salmoneum TaxID=53361 RepID=A0ABN3HFD3_9ACTN
MPGGGDPSPAEQTNLGLGCLGAQRGLRERLAPLGCSRGEHPVDVGHWWMQVHERPHPPYHVGRAHGQSQYGPGPDAFAPGLRGQALPLLRAGHSAELSTQRLPGPRPRVVGQAGKDVEHTVAVIRLEQRDHGRH